MERSVMTNSGVQSFMISSAVSPSFATRMSYPWLERLARNTRVICGSSSTTRMRRWSFMTDSLVDRSGGLLSHDVNIHRGRVAQKFMNRREVKIFLHAGGCRASEHHLSDVFF